MVEEEEQRKNRREKLTCTDFKEFEVGEKVYVKGKEGKRER